MRAHVVVNRRARLLRDGGPLLDELCRARPGIEVHETGSLEELDALVRALMAGAKGRREAFVFAGGDGSYMAGVSALARAAARSTDEDRQSEGGASQEEPLPPVAFAPGGTVCTVARNWGMSGNRVRWLARLLDAIADDSVRVTRRPSLRVRDGRGGDRVGFIFGGGLVARFFELYDARGAGGNVAAARIVARVFAGSFVRSPFARRVLEPSACAITIDGAPAPFDRVSLLCASVVRDLGLKMRLTYRAGEELERFHTVATPLGPRALGPQMPLVLAGRPLVGAHIDDLVAHLGLSFPRGTGAYVLDGDLLRADAITVNAGPVLKVLG